MGFHYRGRSFTSPTHPGLEKLLRQLKERPYQINLEAAGVRIVSRIFQLVDFISFDYKPPSTGVEFPLRNLATICERYPGKFQIKSVVADARDFYACQKAYGDLHEAGLGDGFEWCLTPSYEPHQSFNSDLFIEIMSLNYQSGHPFRVIGQQHKWVYGPQKTQV